MKVWSMAQVSSAKNVQSVSDIIHLHAGCVAQASVRGRRSRDEAVPAFLEIVAELVADPAT